MLRGGLRGWEGVKEVDGCGEVLEDVGVTGGVEVDLRAGGVASLHCKSAL
jgi:hypothetical protein